MSRVRGPLRYVTERGFLRGQGWGWWDRLECGHLVSYDGVDHTHRRCPECPPTAVVDQESLW